ncbi:F-box domain-containing protein [Dioscorea alata]|uniref:F-box domain-containing protein n=1 Tax=Dioscorea alata TaxID=55571 RepID=A0ACB7WJI7_DIOAL|nr:F-box domain-containing protein [Dioscorea alata]
MVALTKMMKNKKFLSKKSTRFVNVTKKKKKKEKHTLICNKPEKMKSVINEDIVTEILLRLPTKSIFKFKCVSKTWLKIITDPWFVNAFKSFNTALLPVLQGVFHVKHYHYLAFDPVNSHLNSPPILMNHLHLDLKGLSISSITSSNGFLLLCATDGRKIVYNPVTRRRLIIPKMKGNQEWYHALGLIHIENDNHVKAVFAYKLATDDIQMKFEIVNLELGFETLDRDALPEQWREMLIQWQCMTKDIEFRVYCSKKNEWNCERLVSKFPNYVCFNPEQMAGVSIGGNLYWVTLDGTVLNYDSECQTARLIGAPTKAAGPHTWTLSPKSLHCSASGILVYCAYHMMMRELWMWEFNDQKTWVEKGRVKLVHPVNKLLYVCHEQQAVLFQTCGKVKRYVISEDKCEQICAYLIVSGNQATPYVMSPWPAALNGDEACHSSSSSTSENNKNDGSKDLQCCETKFNPQPLAYLGRVPPFIRCGGDRLFINYVHY